MNSLHWQELELNYPYSYKGRKLQTKDSALIKWDGHVSELSVFPGLHQLKRAYYEELLQKVPWKLVETPESPLKDLKELCKWANRYRDPIQTPANLTQAIDGLLFSFLGNHKELPVKLQKIYDLQEMRIPIAQLITDLKNQQPASQQGNTYKVKVARNSFEDELEQLRKLFDQNPNAKFRLDPNDNWGESEVTQLYLSLSEQQRSQIEYLEDPCSMDQWCKSFSQHGLNIALEKSQAVDIPGLSALVYRPSSQSGFFEGLLWIETLQRSHPSISPILSSSFESTLGLCLLTVMAQYIDNPKAQGLGTLSHIKTPQLESYPIKFDQSSNTLVVPGFSLLGP